MERKIICKFCNNIIGTRKIYCSSNGKDTLSVCEKCKGLRYLYSKKNDTHNITDVKYWMKYTNNDIEMATQAYKNCGYLLRYTSKNSSIYLPKIFSKLNIDISIFEKFLKRIFNNEIKFDLILKNIPSNSYKRWNLALGFDIETSKKISTYFTTSQEGFSLRGDKNKYEEWKNNVKESLENKSSKPSSFSKEYWINKGSLEEEAKNIVKTNNIRNLNYFAAKYGIDEGTKKYKSMCEKRSKSSSLKGYIERFGREEGVKEFKRINKSRAITLEKYLIKYGEEGIKKYEEYITSKISSNNIISKISNEFLFEVENKTKMIIDRETPIGKYIADGKNKNIIFEFFGDYWHKNPFSGYTDFEKWKDDSAKIKYFLNVGYRVIIVWERSFKFIREKTIDLIYNFLETEDTFLCINCTENKNILIESVKEICERRKNASKG